MQLLELGELTKLYYSIGEVSEMFGVSPSLIRYWESEFPQLRPNKNTKGERRYTRQNIEQLYQIYQLVKEKGYTLDGAKKELKENKGRQQQLLRIERTLIQLRKNLEQLKGRLSEKD